MMASRRNSVLIVDDEVTLRVDAPFAAAHETTVAL